MTDQNPLGELLPCPFCGTAVDVCEAISPEGIRRGDRPSYDIDCDGCGVWRRFDSEADAIEAWNLRAALAASPPSRALSQDERDKLIDSLEGGLFLLGKAMVEKDGFLTLQLRVSDLQQDIARYRSLKSQTEGEANG